MTFTQLMFVILFFLLKETRYLCAMLLFLCPSLVVSESVECDSVCSRCYYPAVSNSILPHGGPSVAPDF